MVLRMSTRKRSLHGAHPQAMTYSCRPEQKSKSQNFRAAPDGCSRDLIRRYAFLPELVGHQGERNSCQKKKQRRGKSSAQLRPHEKRSLPRLRIQPGIVAMRLKHQDAGQAAHPVNVGETRCGGSRHATLRKYKTQMCGRERPAVPSTVCVESRFELSSRAQLESLAGINRQSAADRSARPTWIGLRHGYRDCRRAAAVLVGGIERVGGGLAGADRHACAAHRADLRRDDDVRSVADAP